MITRFFTSVNVSFNPFSRQSRTSRLFLALLPNNARNTMKVQTSVLGMEGSVKGGRVEVVFKDGKEIKLDTGKMTLKDLVEEMDRHSRTLKRKEDLAG